MLIYIDVMLSYQSSTSHAHDDDDIASLSLDALQIVFQHDSDLFSTGEAGRVSILCKSALKIVEESGTWQRLWEFAIALRRDYQSIPIRKGCPSGMETRYRVMSWNGKGGLLPFFLDPDDAPSKKSATNMLLDACSRDTALHVEYCVSVQIHSQRLEFVSSVVKRIKTCTSFPSPKPRRHFFWENRI